MLAPEIVGDPAAVASLSPPLREAVPRGWASALSKVPAKIARVLTRPGADWQREWATLPVTVVHGDAKVANFAVLPDGRVSAFDWALLGIAPCTIDIGWYLAVNASRLTGTKESVLARYRALLELALHRSLPDTLWQQLIQVAVVAGARMLLWSKAMAVDAGREGAAFEWAWWVSALEATAC